MCALFLCSLFSLTSNAAPDDLNLRILPIPAESKKSLNDETNRAFITAKKDWFTWCPSVIKDKDGKYHMFHTRWPKSIGFCSWLTHSIIVHEIADKPEGPYKEVSIAIPDTGKDRNNWFTAHNSKIKFFEGKYYLYFIQTRGTNINDKVREEIARTGYSHPRWNTEIRPNQRTFVARSSSINGPWKISIKPIVEPAKTISVLTVNPAVCRGPDGTYFMIVKGDKPEAKGFVRNQALATSPRPEGPWTIQDKPVIDNLDTEDCSMWYDSVRKRFYAVFHAHTFIGMMTSEDGLKWEKASQYKLCAKEIPFDDGTNWNPERMERPFILTDEQGQPLMLFVGCKKGNMTVNIALKLDQVTEEQ